MTVAEFAAALGVSAATVYRWEAAPGPLDLQQRPLTARCKRPLGRFFLDRRLFIFNTPCAVSKENGSCLWVAV